MLIIYHWLIKRFYCFPVITWIKKELLTVYVAYRFYVNNKLDGYYKCDRHEFYTILRMFWMWCSQESWDFGKILATQKLLLFFFSLMQTNYNNNLGMTNWKFRRNSCTVVQINKKRKFVIEFIVFNQLFIWAGLFFSSLFHFVIFWKYLQITLDVILSGMTPILIGIIRFNLNKKRFKWKKKNPAHM